MQTTVYGVRFSCMTGEPRVVQLKAEVESTEQLSKYVQLIGGVTGYESFCLNNITNIMFNDMKQHGWWACAGTRGRWDALYIHGLQITKLLRDLKLTGDSS